MGISEEEIETRAERSFAPGDKLLTTQESDKWRDIKEVNDSIAINVRFGLERLSRQAVDEWCDIKKVDDTVSVDVSKHDIS